MGCFPFYESLTEKNRRRYAAMVVTRIDWKYALHLPLTYRGFDVSVRSEFRERLIKNKAQRLIFDRVLEKMKAEGFLLHLPQLIIEMISHCIGRPFCAFCSGLILLF